MAFPSEEARTLRPHPIAALGQYLAWFLFLRGWYSEVYLIWVYHSSSLRSAFSLTSAPHLEQDFLWHYLCIFTCPLNLSESGCALSRAQSHALLELQASACAWPPWFQHRTAPDALSLLYSEFSSTQYCPSYIPPHSATFYYLLLFFSLLLLKEVWEGERILILPFFPMSETCRSHSTIQIQNWLRASIFVFF